jgi:trehalose 6-phosphate phosphatase
VSLDPAWAPVVQAPATAALLVDFDGTLAPIVDDPGRATPQPDAIAALIALADRLAVVAVVTGRPVAYVRTFLADPRVVVVGQYGLERDDGAGVVTDPRVLAFAPAVAAAARELEHTWPALRVERKGEIAITLHWRERPDQAPDPVAVAAIADAHGLTAWPARMACELRPPIEVDKGTAVAELLLTRGLEVAAFAGDDEGDRRAFAALDGWCAASSTRRALRIAIASDESPSALVAAADLVVAGPRELAAQLSALAAAI